MNENIKQEFKSVMATMTNPPRTGTERYNQMFDVFASGLAAGYSRREDEIEQTINSRVHWKLAQKKASA